MGAPTPRTPSEVSYIFQWRLRDGLIARNFAKQFKALRFRKSHAAIGKLGKNTNILVEWSWLHMLKLDSKRQIFHILRVFSSAKNNLPNFPTFMSVRITFAGFPATIDFSGTSEKTNAPAATITSFEIVTPGIIVLPPPIKQRSPMLIGRISPVETSRASISVLKAISVSAPTVIAPRFPAMNRLESEMLADG
jgi:hypothetical protein